MHQIITRTIFIISHIINVFSENCKFSRMECDDQSSVCLQEINFLDNVTGHGFFKQEKGKPHQNEILHLLESNIEEINDVRYVFLGCATQLRVLQLGYNHVKTVKSKSFQDLGVLEELHLNHNEIAAIEQCGFIGLNNLLTLNLQNNKIESSQFLNDCENTFSKLIVLNLANNKISKINKTDFKEMEKLQMIYLNNNEISTLCSGGDNVLLHLNKLVYIDISNNRLTRIELNTFEHCSKLLYYNMQHNLFTQNQYIKVGDDLAVIPSSPLIPDSSNLNNMCCGFYVALSASVLVNVMCLVVGIIYYIKHRRVAKTSEVDKCAENGSVDNASTSERSDQSKVTTIAEPLQFAKQYYTKKSLSGCVKSKEVDGKVRESETKSKTNSQHSMESMTSNSIECQDVDDGETD